jgi:hypothetical protein
MAGNSSIPELREPALVEKHFLVEILLRHHLASQFEAP